MNEEKARRRWRQRTLFAVLIFAITCWTVLNVLEGESDYSAHIKTAEGMHKSGFWQYILTENPYFMWHLFVKLLYRFFQPIKYAAAIVTAAANLAVYLITEQILYKYGVSASAPLGFGLFFVGPLYAPWYNQNYYLGQTAINQWHNPTNLMVRPFAVAGFFLILCILAESGRGGVTGQKPVSCSGGIAFPERFGKAQLFAGDHPRPGAVYGAQLHTGKV